MSHVNEQDARKAAERGTLIGKTEPGRDTKGTWWQVYLHDGELIACVFDEMWGASCGERIDESELGSYCDDVDAARTALTKARPSTVEA